MGDDLVTSPILLRLIIEILLGSLLFAFHRSSGKSYALQWARYWALLAIGSGLSLLAIGQGAINVLTQGAGFAAVAFLIVGGWELILQRPMRLRDQSRLVMAAMIVGMLPAAISLSFGSAMEGTTSISQPQFLFFQSCSSLVIAYLIWKKRGKPDASGFRLLAVLFGIAGVTEQIEMLPAVRSLEMVDLILPTMLGLGMVIALVEDQREASTLAAQQVEHLAYHDPLTGLPNRALFFDRLVIATAEARRHHHQIAVFFLDIDRFKQINDSLGHSTGDALLRSLSARIRRCLREEDTLARFGGDEFALLAPQISAPEDAARIARKLLDEIRKPFDLAGHTLVVTCSLGISMSPSDGEDAETLVRNADTAMYRAKEQGRDCYQLYTPSMNARILEILDLEYSLQNAVEHGQLRLEFQPIVSVQDQTLAGAEALVRWEHPTLGRLLPDQFIPIAESCGAIIPLGRWVLQRACQVAAGWQSAGLPLTISVNLSGRQLLHPRLVRDVNEALQASGLSPALLQLEITESVAIPSDLRCLATLEELRSLGVRLALDDFGKGYSSLSQLQRLPIDVLKLDSAFLDAIVADGAPIIGAVVEMVRILGMKVVAEGIELEEQWELLRKHGCDFVQGYLMSPPISEEDFLLLLGSDRNQRPRLSIRKPSRMRLVQNEPGA